MNNKIIKITLAALIAVLTAGIIAFAAVSNTENDSDKKIIGYIMTGTADEPGWNGMN